MSTTRTHAGLFSLVLLLVLGCQSEIVDRPPAFLVTVEQRQELQQIFSDVRKDARKLRHKSEEAVEDLLSAYDADIQAMLDGTQWTNYNAHQRALWTQQIYRSIRPRGSGGSFSTGGYQPAISMPPSVN